MGGKQDQYHEQRKNDMRKGPRSGCAGCNQVHNGRRQREGDQDKDSGDHSGAEKCFEATEKAGHTHNRKNEPSKENRCINRVRMMSRSSDDSNKKY